MKVGEKSGKGETSKNPESLASLADIGKGMIARLGKGEAWQNHLRAC